MRRQSIVKGDFEVKLDAKEILERAHRSAELHKEIGDLSAEMKSFLRIKKTEVATRKEELERCVDAIRDGHEMRQLTALEIRDYADGTVTYVEKDSGRFLKRRTMDSAERQMAFDELFAEANNTNEESTEEEQEDPEWSQKKLSAVPPPRPSPETLHDAYERIFGEEDDR